jgi:hypothetical protein
MFKPDQSVQALDYEFGTRESTEITMPAVGDATQGDHITIYNAAGSTQSIFIDIDANGTAPTSASYTGSDSKTSVAYVNEVQEAYTITAPATAEAAQGDYIMIYDQAGNSTAVWLDIDANGTAPTGALYAASDAQVEVDIVTGDTATQVATKMHTAISGVIADITFTDGLDGTIGVELDDAGAATDAVVKNADDSDAGSITITAVTQGVTATTAIAGGALLQAAISLTDVTSVDNGDGTVTIAMADIGNATDPLVKNADSSGAGSITVSATDGASEVFPYPSPGDSPSTILVNPSSKT